MKQSFITQNILGGEIYYIQIEHPILQINKENTAIDCTNTILFYIF